jgi:hypothetical protein
MRLTRTLALAGALVLSAVVGGTLIGSALAQDEGTETDTGAYCDTFMDAFASELGTARDEVVAAGKAAANTALDAAVDAGDISEERAAEIRQRIEEADGGGCGWFGHGIGRGGHGLAHGFLGGDVFEAAADALGIESAELIDRLDEASSLETLAGEAGVAYDDVKTAILAAVQADLDAAVADGLDQERADAAIERLTAWLDEGGQVGGLRFGHHGRGHGFGPWDDRDEDADPDAEESGA